MPPADSDFASNVIPWTLTEHNSELRTDHVLGPYIMSLSDYDDRGTFSGFVVISKCDRKKLASILPSHISPERRIGIRVNLKATEHRTESSRLNVLHRVQLEMILMQRLSGSLHPTVHVACIFGRALPHVTPTLAVIMDAHIPLHKWFDGQWKTWSGTNRIDDIGKAMGGLLNAALEETERVGLLMSDIKPANMVCSHCPTTEMPNRVYFIDMDPRYTILMTNAESNACIRYVNTYLFLGSTYAYAKNISDNGSKEVTHRSLKEVHQRITLQYKTGESFKKWSICKALLSFPGVTNTLLDNSLGMISVPDGQTVDDSKSQFKLQNEVQGVAVQIVRSLRAYTIALFDLSQNWMDYVDNIDLHAQGIEGAKSAECVDVSDVR